MRNGKRSIGAALGFAIMLCAGTASAACTLVYTSPPEADGSYTELWRCDGQLVTRRCRGNTCVWDYRDEQ